MCTDRSTLFGESETEMRFIGSLDDIFEKIIFSIFLVFNILKNEVFINIVIQKHVIGIRTITRQGFERIFKIRKNRIVENAIGKLTRFIEFVGIKESEKVTTISLFMIERVL